MTMTTTTNNSERVNKKKIMPKAQTKKTNINDSNANRKRKRRIERKEERQTNIKRLCYNTLVSEFSLKSAPEQKAPAKLS